MKGNLFVNLLIYHIGSFKISMVDFGIKLSAYTVDLLFFASFNFREFLISGLFSLKFANFDFSQVALLQK